jgi:hypothetical protein
MNLGTAPRNPESAPIERLSAREDGRKIADHFAGGAPHPLIFADAAADWPAREKWNLGFFESAHGSQVGIAPLAFGGRPVRGKATLLRAFIQNLDASSAALPGLWVGTEEFASPPDEAPLWSFLWESFKNDRSLFDDIAPFPPNIPNLTASLPRDVYDALESILGRLLTTIYISRKGTVTPLHRDWGHTFGCLVQFQGRKAVVLFPPTDYERVGDADFDPESPDYLSYPQMRGRPSYEAILEPTEMLVIPPNWLHYTRSLDHSVTLSHNFFNQANFGPHMRFLLREIAKREDKAELFNEIEAMLKQAG